MSFGSSDRTQTNGRTETRPDAGHVRVCRNKRVVLESMLPSHQITSNKLNPRQRLIKDNKYLHTRKTKTKRKKEEKNEPGSLNCLAVGEAFRLQ